MRQAYSVSKLISTKFTILEFEGTWKDAIGCPELSGTWMIKGDVKNGKTTLAMMLSKYLTGFTTTRVAYNSVEEGLSQTIKAAVERVGMHEVGRKWILLNKESLKELKARLDKHKSPDVIFIDSLQFMGLKFSEYKQLKERYPNKLFIYISHVEGKLPAGSVARQIYRDASVVFTVEGFKAFPVSRFGGGKTIVISSQKAAEYWGHN